MVFELQTLGNGDDHSTPLPKRQPMLNFPSRVTSFLQDFVPLTQLSIEFQWKKIWMLWIELSETKIDGLMKKSIDEEQAKMERTASHDTFLFL